MISLQDLIGQSVKCFDLLEAGADEARNSVRLLNEMLGAGDQSVYLGEFGMVRGRGKRIREEIVAEYCATFMTPLDRDDAESLSEALIRIPKTSRQFGERLLISRHHLKGGEFLRQAELLVKAVETVYQMVKGLRLYARPDRVKEQNDRLQYYENEADRMMLEFLKVMYARPPADLVRFMVQRELYEILEKLMSRCSEAGNIVFYISLKNS